jgi:hypothetical protein
MSIKIKERQMQEQPQPAQIDRTMDESAGQNWKSLYKIGACAALASLVFFPIQIGVFLVNPPPDAVIGWFNLLRQKPLVGLVDLDLLLMVDSVLTIMVFLALYAALKQTHQSWMVVGLTLGLVSAVLFIASNPAFAMQSLSQQYFSAGNDSMRTTTLAAGQAVMAGWQGSAFQASYILGSIAAILISVVMLRSAWFSKAAAVMGILANSIAFGLYVPVIGVYISVFSVVFLWVWYLLLALGLFRLGKRI